MSMKSANFLQSVHKKSVNFITDCIKINCFKETTTLSEVPITLTPKNGVLGADSIKQRGTIFLLFAHKCFVIDPIIQISIDGNPFTK